VSVNRRWFVARHGETVFNAAGRMQGDVPHTPLTRSGFAQAEAMGKALVGRLGARPPLTLWASPTGRALQTLAILAEHLGLDWHQARTDARLSEIGMGEWGGRYYSDVIAEVGPIFDTATGIFTRRGPGGETYGDVEARLQAWIDDTQAQEGDRLIVMHGVSSCVLRGMLCGEAPRPECGAPVAPGLPQGAIVEIAGGAERVLLRAQGEGAY
jgi:probable phosphoglycerate mutase